MRLRGYFHSIQEHLLKVACQFLYNALVPQEQESVLGIQENEY